MAQPDTPPKMLACQVIKYNSPYTIHTIPTPSPGPNDLLVKVAVASLCHTDFLVANGVFQGPLPQTASHEGVGAVVGVGSAVTDFQIGDRVMCGLFTHRCGECVSCRGPDDRKHYCPNADPPLGVGRDGAFAEYLVCDAQESNRLPKEVGFEIAAPFACAGRTVYRGVVEARLEKGQWLGLVGSGGGLGHLGIQFAKAIGLKVVGIDARDEGLELSRQTGADVVIDARKGIESVVEEVKKVTGGEGCSATVNVSDARTAAALACAITMMHGTMIQIAQPDEMSVPFRELIFRDIRIKGSLLCSKKQGQDMLEMVAKHRISVKTSAFLGLEKIPELVEMAHGGHMQGKGIIIIDDAAVEKERKSSTVKV